MAGHGPTRKDDDTRARRNKGAPPLKVVHDVEPDEQPELPPLMVQYEDAAGRTRTRRIAWPAQTKKWWQMWANSPLSNDFTATDWSELLDTARLHAEYWRGNLKLAAELRQRVAKFGATPEDRVRLRIQFAMANRVEAPSSKPQQPSEDDAGEDSAQPQRGPRRLVS